MTNNELASKIKSLLSLPKNEEVVDIFKPLQYGNIKGVLILADKQLIFVEEIGIISKSFKAVFSVGLPDLAEIRKTSTSGASRIRLSQFEVSSSNSEGLVRFYNDRIWPQVQRSRGLIEYEGKWMSPEEKYEREQSDKGMVKFKGE